MAEASERCTDDGVNFVSSCPVEPDNRSNRAIAWSNTSSETLRCSRMLNDKVNERMETCAKRNEEF